MYCLVCVFELTLIETNRFHIEISHGEMSRLWPQFIKAANETLEFHEFMRHFGLKVKSGGVLILLCSENFLQRYID